MRVRVGNGRRRDVLRGVFAAAVAVAVAPFVGASRPTRGEPYAPDGPANGPSRELADFEARFVAGFDEMYGGRRIRGRKDGAAGHARMAGSVRTAPGGLWRVTVDDRPLHLMRRADGGFLTMIDHYRAYPTPLAAARAAVDELGGTLRLRAADMGEGQGEDRGEGHGHGVHA
ncbi:tyrosinase family oxidase copper chaperone [Streptomyces kroppenstedtii]|uniref:tyrosinase family oxidase copper chaperone n=1 Tax=Streptomyces kroppenstedtii TaxID=3051181 RepID=UPI0028D7A660|nr:tyrosinase family oxidase copper chaperone [Streptomyces sp. DSM 40484]